MLHNTLSHKADHMNRLFDISYLHHFCLSLCICVCLPTRPTSGMCKELRPACTAVSNTIVLVSVFIRKEMRIKEKKHNRQEGGKMNVYVLQFLGRDVIVSFFSLSGIKKETLCITTLSGKQIGPHTV